MPLATRSLLGSPLPSAEVSLELSPYLPRAPPLGTPHPDLVTTPPFCSPAPSKGGATVQGVTVHSNGHVIQGSLESLSEWDPRILRNSHNFALVDSCLFTALYPTRKRRGDPGDGFQKEAAQGKGSEGPLTLPGLSGSPSPPHPLRSHCTSPSPPHPPPPLPTRFLQLLSLLFKLAGHHSEPARKQEGEGEQVKENKSHNQTAEKLGKRVPRGKGMRLSR